MSNAALPSEATPSRSMILLVLVATLVAAVGGLLLLGRPAPAIELTVPEQPAPFVLFPAYDPSVPQARVVFDGREISPEEIPPTF